MTAMQAQAWICPYCRNDHPQGRPCNIINCSECGVELDAINSWCMVVKTAPKEYRERRGLCQGCFTRLTIQQSGVTRL